MPDVPVQEASMLPHKLVLLSEGSVGSATRGAHVLVDTSEASPQGLPPGDQGLVVLYPIVFSRGLQPVPGPVTGTGIPLPDKGTGTGRVDILKLTRVWVRAG